MPRTERGIINVIQPTFKVYVAVDDEGEHSSSAHMDAFRAQEGVAHVLVADVIQDDRIYGCDIVVFEIRLRDGVSADRIYSRIREQIPNI